MNCKTRPWRLSRLLALAVTFWALPAGAVDAAGAPADTVVATQGSGTVTLADIDAHVAHIPLKDRASFFESPRRIQSLLRNLLLQKQLAAAAREAGLDRRPEFQAPLGHVSDAGLAKAEIDRFRESLPKPDVHQLAKEEYLAHKEKYATPEVLDVKHILVSTSVRGEAEARALAEDVLERARKDPAKFDELVQIYSEEPNKAENKGLMHDAGSKDHVPEFAEAARALGKPGDLSPVVQSKYGFHVLQLAAKVPAKQATFEEVREGIEAKMLKDYADEAVHRHTDELRNLPVDAKVDVVESLRTRYAQATAPADSQTPAK